MRRKATPRNHSRITDRDIEQLRQAVVDGWPWRLRESERFCEMPLAVKLQIVASHLTGIFSLPCGFPTDPHPSDETVAFLQKELAADLKKAEKQWGALVPKKDRWRSVDLRARTPSWGPRETY